MPHVERDGVKIFYESFGQGTPVVFLHPLREMALDARAVLDHAEIDHAILVGNSAGSMIAVQTALDAPERALAMMLVSCATHLAPSVPGEVLRAYDARFEAAFDYMIQGSISATTKRGGTTIRSNERTTSTKTCARSCRRSESSPITAGETGRGAPPRHRCHAAASEER